MATTKKKKLSAAVAQFPADHQFKAGQMLATGPGHAEAQRPLPIAIDQPERHPAFVGLFERAHSQQRAGQLKEAEATCRELLALEETHAGAWHLLGVVALRLGSSDAIA